MTLCWSTLQVAVKLTEVLPNALLASLELVYLGGLPRDMQQRLMTTWQQQVTMAVTGVDHSPATLPATAGAPVASEAATNAVDAEQTQGRCLLKLLGHHSASAAAAVPAESEMVSQLQLLQPLGPLSQQLRFAAAASEMAAHCGMPLLVTDPWDLLADILVRGGHKKCAAPAAAAATTKGNSSWEVVSAWSVNSSKVETSTADYAAAMLTKLEAAFAAGINVCVQIQCGSKQAMQLAAAAAALYTSLQLQEADDADRPNGLQAGPDSSSSSAAHARNVCARVACTARSRATSSIGYQRAIRGAAAASTGDGSGFRGPKLVIQVISTEFKLPAELAGLCQVIDLGGLKQNRLLPSSPYLCNQSTVQQEQQQQEQAKGSQQQSSVQDMGYLSEIVLRVNLQIVALEEVAAVAAAAEEAEACQQQYAADEAKLMRRLTQVRPALACCQRRPPMLYAIELHLDTAGVLDMTRATPSACSYGCEQKQTVCDQPHDNASRGHYDCST